MNHCKITVLKRIMNVKLAEEYCQEKVRKCEFFQEGQEFLVEGEKKPENFCDWAWNDIQKSVVTLMNGGGFKGWMKNHSTNICCCTDGIRPVVFKVERI